MSKQTSKNRGPNVPAADLVKACIEAHQNGEGTKTVADKLDLKVGSVYVRMYNLRKKGVAIPEFPRGGGGGRKTDVEGLNELIAGLQK